MVDFSEIFSGFEAFCLDGINNRDFGQA